MGEKLFGKESKMIHFRSVFLLLSVLFVWFDQFSSYLHQHSVNLQPTLQHPVKFAPVNLATSWSTSRNLFQEASAQQKPLFIRSNSNFQVFLKPSTRPSGSRIQQNDPPAPIAQNESKSSGFLHKIKHFFSSRYEALNDLDGNLFYLIYPFPYFYYFLFFSCRSPETPLVYDLSQYHTPDTLIIS